MLEKELEEKFRKAVKAEGGRAYKFQSPGHDGVPDRLVVLPGGKTGFVELKQKGKKPTPLQALRIRELRELGCFVTVLDSPEMIPAVIFAINRGAAGEHLKEIMGILEAGGTL